MVPLLTKTSVLDVVSREDGTNSNRDFLITTKIRVELFGKESLQMLSKEKNT
jgi:riboflavin synthase